LLLVLSAVLVAGVVFVVGRKGDGNTSAARPDPGSGGTAPLVHDAPLNEVTLPPREAHDPNPQPPPRAFGPADYAGRGILRGELIAGPGVALPKAWSLVIEPHPWMSGSEHAVKKRIEFENGERTFDVTDLPLGAYRVRAEAPKLNSTDAAVLLVKTSSNQFLTLLLQPAGTVDGRVFAADQAPAEGLDVALESKSTQVRAHTTVGPDASFAFHDVLDGEYVLYFGPPEAPLFPPVDIAFRAPTLRIADRTLPPTGAIEILVLDERGTPVEDVEITGSGAPKGTLRVATDPLGKAVARWLLPAAYRLDAVAPDGRRTKSTVAVTVGEPSLVTLQFVPR
jgi:hypothetical protein